MPWSDKSVSPCTYTPANIEIETPLFGTSLPPHTNTLVSVQNGKIIPSVFPGWKNEEVRYDRFINRIGGGVILPTGRILLSCSGDGTAGNQAVFMASDDGGQTFYRLSFVNGRGPAHIMRYNPADGKILATNGLTSTDMGISWTPWEPSTWNNYAVYGWSLTYGNGIYLLWGAINGSPSPVLQRSTDGINWSVVPNMEAVKCVVWSAAANKFFCTRQGTAWNLSKIMSSEDGLTWTDVFDYTTAGGNITEWNVPNFYNGVVAGNFILLPSRYSYLSFDAGQTWTNSSTPFLVGQMASLRNGNLLVSSSHSGSGAAIERYQWSNNKGLSWSMVVPGFPTLNEQDAYTQCHLMKIDENTLYIYHYETVNNVRRYYRSILSVTDWPQAILRQEHAFQPTAPAKLASIPSAVLTLDTTNADGTVTLYMQHYNDEVGRWESYDGVADAWTEIGSYNQTTNNISMPDLPARAGEKVRIRLVFANTDGTKPAPAFVSLSLSWTSDITAPDAPTISRITSTTPTGGQAGYRADFGELPSDARHFIVEGRKNGGEWLPFSTRAKFETGYGYMKFRGDLNASEAAGERNESNISFAKGLAVGDIVQVRIATEDNVGNRSAFTESEPITIVESIGKRRGSGLSVPGSGPVGV